MNSLLSVLLLSAHLDEQSGGVSTKINGNWKWKRAVIIWECMMKCLM